MIQDQARSTSHFLISIAPLITSLNRIYKPCQTSPKSGTCTVLVLYNSETSDLTNGTLTMSCLGVAFRGPVNLLLACNIELTTSPHRSQTLLVVMKFK